MRGSLRVLSEWRHPRQQWGTTVGNFSLHGYAIGDVLGSGAGSRIYEAVEKRSKSERAIKVVYGDKHSRFVMQATNEFRVAGGLKHSNLVEILRLVTLRKFFRPCGVALVMEYLPGKTLEESVGEPLEHLVYYFWQVGRALQCLHGYGIVHADVKPSNIMVTPSRSAKLFDFGLAGPVNAERRRVQGSLDFLAPEQVSKGVVTPQTDIYCFGASMFKVFMGMDMPSALKALSNRASSNYLSAGRMSELNPHLPKELVNLVSVCCEGDPASRPRGMKEVTDILGSIHMRLQAQDRVS